MLLESGVSIALKSFLTKITTSIIKAGLVQCAFKAFEVYSVFQTVYDTLEYIRSENSIPSLSNCVIAVVSDYLGQAMAEKILQIGHDSFTVERQPSGIYIASKVISPFRVSHIKRGFFSGKIKSIGNLDVKRKFFSRDVKQVGSLQVKRTFWTGSIKQVGDAKIERGIFGGIKSIGGKKVKRSIFGTIKEIGGQKVKRDLFGKIKEFPSNCPEAGIAAIIEEEEKGRGDDYNK